MYHDATPSFIEADCSPGEGFTCCDLDAQEGIDAVNNNGGIGFIAHPYNMFFYGMGTEWEDWDHTGFAGLEIINGEFDGNDGKTINNPGGDDDSWIEFLQSETNPNNGFIVGIANSDAHQIDEFNSFTYCYLDDLTASEIVSSLENGHCVASTGPFVEFTLDGNIIGSVVNTMSGENTIEVSASSTAEFGQLEWLRVYVDEEFRNYIPLSGYSYADSIDVDLNSSNKYIRLEVYTSSDRRAYTNPIWVDVTDCSCGGWSSGSCGDGNCSSNQRQYTRTCTPSACASETQCIYDESCEEEESEVNDCTESGYEYCIESEYGDCDVSIAQNLYTNVNDIQWGAVNDAWDPYVIDKYTIGWKDVDAEQMYYDCDGNVDCEYGGCDCNEIPDEDTMVTVTAPGIAYRDEILGYDDTENYACWVWWYPFYPRYGDENNIYVLNCFNDSDCSSSKYCDKSGDWDDWDCVNDKSNGQSCTSDSQCSSGSCDNDGEGLNDDGWCFAPYNTYFDGQETSYCEYSTGSGNSICDERQSGEDLNLCLGLSYYEEECNAVCETQDITSVFECIESGCSCEEYLCDGLTEGNNITTCSGDETYFADKCTSTAGGEDRGDNICRSLSFASECTADLECNGIVAGTGNCNSTCSYAPPDDTYKFYVQNSSGDNVAWLGDLGNILLKGNCYSGETCDNPGPDSFIMRNSTGGNVAFVNSTGDLCVFTGDCSDQSLNCDSPFGNSFIIRNESHNNMIYIDETGDLCLVGELYENAEL